MFQYFIICGVLINFIWRNFLNFALTLDYIKDVTYKPSNIEQDRRTQQPLEEEVIKASVIIMQPFMA